MAKKNYLGCIKFHFSSIVAGVNHKPTVINYTKIMSRF